MGAEPEQARIYLGGVDMKRGLRTNGVAATMIVALFGGTSTVVAQGQGGAAQQTNARPVLDEIIVTAQKRDQDIQDVPISVQAMSGEFIQEFNVERLDDLSQYVPNLVVNQSYVAESIGIRGISSGGGQIFEQSVGTFVDGVYFGRSKQTATTFLDVQRVEVLRGPQVTYFGNNAIAGALNIQTRRPGTEWQGYALTTLAQDDDRTIEAAFGGPATDTFGIRGAVKYAEMGGFMKNTATGADEVERETNAARLSMVWDPSDKLSIYAKLEDSSTDQWGSPRQISECPIPGQVQPPELENSGPTGWCVQAHDRLGTVFEPDYTRESAGLTTRAPATVPLPLEMTEPERNFIDASNGNVTIDYLMGDYTFTSLTGYAEYEGDLRADVDGTPWAQMHAQRYEKFDQVSQEFRITSPVGNKAEWMAGLYWQHNDLDLVITNTNFFAGGFGQFILNSAQEEDTVSAFSAVTINISDTWRFNVGGRYSDVEKFVPLKELGYATLGGVTLAQVANQFSFGYGAHTIADYPAGSDTYAVDFFDFNIGLQWDVSADTMLYVSYTEGSKAGGFALDDRNPIDGPFQFTEENVEAIEAGLRGDYFDNRVRLSLSLFHNEFTDLQVSTFDDITLIFAVQNAGGAQTEGIEFETQWAATDNLRFTLAGSFLDAKYTNWAYGCTIYQQLVYGLSSTDCQAAGEPLGDAPDVNLTLGLRHTAPLKGGALELRTSLNAVYEDEQRVSDTPGDPRTTIPATTIVDLRIAIGDAADRWEVAAFGRNLTDEFKPLGIGDVPVQSGAIEIGSVARPRYYGVSARYNFGR